MFGPGIMVRVPQFCFFFRVSGEHTRNGPGLIEVESFFGWWFEMVMMHDDFLRV